jgi:hypothetical protein
VKLADVTASKQRRAMHNFLFERIQILIGFMLLAGNDFIAAAEVAELVAERNMDVERQRTLRIARDSLLKISLAEGIGETPARWGMTYNAARNSYISGLGPNPSR